MPEKRQRRVEIMIDNRMLGFLRPTAVAGLAGGPRKRDSLEFLLPRDGGLPKPEIAEPKAS